jgi:triosephosphate isomerase
MRPLIAGNWKMHGLGPQLAEIEAVAASVAAMPLAPDVLLCVPATLVSRAAATVAGRIAIGGEDCHAEIAGAFTGDISAEMIKDAGATAVIVGHSERRRDHGETDAMVAAKAKAAWRAGLLAIVCIGETRAERDAGQTIARCREQIVGSLPLEPNRSAMTAIAYEPLWAVGSGRTPTTSDIAEVHLAIRAYLTTLLGSEGNRVRILYGGSVTPDNAALIAELPDVDGLLIGGASLNDKDMEAIIQTGGRAKSRVGSRFAS